MVIKDNGFFDWAIPDPGPEHKVYPERNKLLAYIPHDMVGYYSGPDSYTRMREDDAQASWGGSIGYDPRGRPVMWQHYPVWVSTWTSSSRYWNTRGFTTETVREEKPIRDSDPKPMSDDLVEIHMMVLEDLEEYLERTQGFTGIFKRAPALGLNVSKNTRLILEHREVHPQDNATSCPNGRMKRLYAALANKKPKENEMTDSEIQKMIEETIESMNFERDERLREMMQKRIEIAEAAFGETEKVEKLHKAASDQGLIKPH